MIPDLWTLEPAGSPGSAQTLHALAITSATLTRANQSAAILSLTLSRGDALTMDLSPWAWESRWVLRRDGGVVFRGRVATPRRSGDAGRESVTIELRDLWWDLERTAYLQPWSHLTDSGVSTTSIPRALLGRDDEDARETTTQSLARLAAASGGQGVPFTLSALLPSTFAPEIEATNETFAGLIRAVLRRHPSAAATILPTDSSDVLWVADRSLAPAWTLPATGDPTLSLDIAARPDLRADSVHIHYEAEATHWTEQPAEEGETAGLRARRRLAILSDIHPPGSTPTRNSLVMDIATGGSLDAPPPPQPHAVAVKVRPIPEDGATDAAAEKFWLDLTGLASLGLTTDDVKLPTEADDGIQPHRVRFAWEEGDELDPLQLAPSTVNPESEALWRPPDVTDLPNMLVSGSLAEWMRVKAAELVVDATVAVRESAVEDLPPADRARFLAMGPKTGKVQDIPAYLLTREFRVVGTDARTKLYRNWAATATYDPAGDLRAEIEAARERHVVPGLARAMWLDRQTTPWEGSVTLAREDVDGRRYVGRVLNLSGGDSAWTSMRAVIESESHDLGSGRSRIDFGPPQHLSVQDRRELWAVARQARTARAQAAQTMPQPPREEDDEAFFSGSGGGGVYPPTVGPKREPQHPTGGASGWPYWGLAAAGEGQYRIEAPGRIYAAAMDAESALEITDIGEPVEFGSGKWIYLRLTTPDDPAIELVGGAPPSHFPALVLLSEPPAPPVATQVCYPLWEGVAGTMPDGADGIAYEGWWARRWPRGGALVLEWGSYETDDTYAMVPVPILVSL